MNDYILKENENKRLNLRLPLLICFALYNAWQMGAIYFSGQTLSIDGRTPLPVDVGSLTALIAAGYILSIAYMLFLPRFIVWGERIMAGIALLSALTLFLPLSPETLALFYYVQCFCCFIMIGFETAIIINLFTEKTAILHLLVAYSLSQTIVAVLQNDIVNVTFPVFRLFTVVSLILMMIFFFRLPTKREVWPRYVKKEDNFTAPKTFITGIFILIGLGAFNTLFGSAIAESIPHGLSVYYGFSAVFGVIVFWLWKRFGVTPLQSGKVLVALGSLGYILAIAARFVPTLSLFACVLLGAGMTCYFLIPFFALLVVKRYPSRFIAPAVIGIAFVTVLIHTTLLEALRTNLTVLYMVYLLIAVALVVLYLLLEPYLLYSFRGKPLISDERAAELNNAAKAAKTEGKTLPEDIPAVKTVPDAVIVLEETSGHPDDELTERERQIAQELMSGLDYKEIAAKLHISPHTVNAHKRSIYNKKDVHNVQGLIMKIGKLTAEQDGGLSDE